MVLKILPKIVLKRHHTGYKIKPEIIITITTTAAISPKNKIDLITKSVVSRVRQISINLSKINLAKYRNPSIKGSKLYSMVKIVTIALYVC